MNEKFRQDMPPPGGYTKFNFARTYAKSMFKPKIVFPVIAGIHLYGYYQSHTIILQNQTEKFEDVDIKNAMEPFLWAERDRYWLKIIKRNRDYENELMKDVPGWKTGTWYGEPIYFTLGDKWWEPHYKEILAHSPARAESREAYWKHHPEYSAPKFYDKWIPKFISYYIR